MTLWLLFLSSYALGWGLLMKRAYEAERRAFHELLAVAEKQAADFAAFSLKINDEWLATCLRLQADLLAAGLPPTQKAENSFRS